MAGTRLCALLGGDMKDKSFPAQFAPESRQEIEEIVTVVCEEMIPAVAGVTATAPDASTVHLELLLLPFNTRAHEPISLTGLLAPFEQPCGGVSATSCSPPGATCTRRPQRVVPRALRKLAARPRPHGL